MKTITVQIGNSDDKLTQAEWSRFVLAVDKHIRLSATTIHFMGGSATWLSWQNVAWIIECEEETISYLKQWLVIEKEAYGQESIAYLEGETQFI